MIDCRNEIHQLKPYIPGKPIEEVKEVYHLEEIIKLASNENPLGCSELAKQAIIDFLATPSLYPDGNCSQLRTKLAQKYTLNEDQFIFGAGSDEVISMITKTYVAPEDEVITCSPTFPQYKAGTLQMGGTIIEVPLKAHRFDLNGILAAITPKTKLIFIANPNNPTGTIVTKEEQLDFIKQVSQDILLIMDEAYIEYIQDASFPDTLSLLDAYPNLMVLRTFSKMYGLASLRIGYGIGHPTIIEKINRVRNPFNVSTVAQVAATAALDDTDFIKKTYQTNEDSKAYTYQRVHALGFSYIPTYGNFVMIDFKCSSAQLFEDLQSKGFIVRPGNHLGMPNYQRVSLGTVLQMTAFFDTVERILK